MSQIPNKDTSEHAAPSKAHERITLPYPKFQKIENIPWRPYAMEGVEYKLLSVNSRTGGFTCMLKVMGPSMLPAERVTFPALAMAACRSASLASATCA